MSDVKPVAYELHKARPNGDPVFHFCSASNVHSYTEDHWDIYAPLYSQETVAALQAEIEALRQKAGTGRAIIIDLLDQIESLQSYELTRDLEGYKAQAIWDSAIENAKRYAAIAK
jgi:t-SNARE complex subunit (syntaxin)